MSSYLLRGLLKSACVSRELVRPFCLGSSLLVLTRTLVMVKYADTGRHMAYIVTVDPDRITEHYKGIVITEVMYPAAVAFPKLLVVFMYLHILTNRYERMVAKLLAGVILATWLSYSLATVFQCSPIPFSWNKTLPNGRCFNVRVYLNSSSAPNIFSDLVVLVLPLRTVWGLNISIGRRVGVLMIFLMGGVYVYRSFFACAVEQHQLTIITEASSLQSFAQLSSPKRLKKLDLLLTVPVSLYSPSSSRSLS
jgi:hypothetical protein